MDVDRLSSRLATPLSHRSCRSSLRSDSNRTKSSRSVFSCPFSARDPRAFPLAGASKEHEQLHRNLHDDAAGARISWWLRQRDKSNEYLKSRGFLVGGPSVISEEVHESGHIASQMTRAFAGAAGRRASKTRQPVPYTIDPAFEHTKQNMELGDHAGKETIRTSTMRDVLHDSTNGKNSGQDSGMQKGRDVSQGGKAERSQRSHRTRRATGSAAAGLKCMGSKPRAEGIKVHPSGKVCEIDEVICGRDISHSPSKLKEHLSREEFQGAAGKKSLGEVARPEGLKTNVAHAVSQVDEVVFGRDMDSSIERTAEHLDDDTFHGAAGRRYVRHVERCGGLKQLPARTVSQADAVILGRDLGHSQDKVEEHMHFEAFKDAAGSHSLGHRPRKEGLKSNFVPGTSQVDQIVFKSDGESLEVQDHLRQEEFRGAAGRKYIGHRESPGGLRPSHMAHVCAVDKIAFGALSDSSNLDAHLRSPNWTGAAGRKYVGAPTKPEGRQPVLGSGLSQVDEIVWGHDIDGSKEKLQAKEKARLNAIGCSA
ncbi:unnamed protein product [Durusdinium trenchii]|uniref:Uncharacterized protein n=1 Tax=Durusdinium trenchii TaxID=1381693 RepID=A0ABP0JSM7_9DINO